jgi:hypothetical protein
MLAWKLYFPENPSNRVPALTTSDVAQVILQDSPSGTQQAQDILPGNLKA